LRSIVRLAHEILAVAPLSIEPLFAASHGLAVASVGGLAYHRGGPRPEVASGKWAGKGITRAMVDWFLDLGPLTQAVLAGTFTWFATALAAALVFVIRSMSRPLLDSMLGFAAGVMIAASVFSLLIPAIELSEGSRFPGWSVAAFGVLAGALFLRLIDAVLPHLHLGLPAHEAEGVSTTWRRTTLLVMAITIHNIPEGLAIGIAFGAAAVGDNGTAVAAAVALTVGISLQNVPEGLAVAMPLRREGVSRFKSFWYGQLSASVEPVAALAGAAAVLIMQPILPVALAFAAGAMLFVVIEELIPESQRGGFTDLVTLSTIGGFVVMMVLDVAFG
jgi:zinc transporter, ZIP family